MILNDMLLLGSAVAGSAVVAGKYIQASRRINVVEEKEHQTLNDVITGFSEYIVELTKEDTNVVVSKEEFIRSNNRKASQKYALKMAPYGVEDAKLQLKELCTEYIESYVDNESVKHILGLNIEEGGEPPAHTMFEILMYRLSKRYGRNAFERWVEDNNLSRERPARDSDDIFDKQYYITVEDVQQTYWDYFKANSPLSQQESREVLATLVYINWKGFGAIDTLRSMNVNGVNIGTSGSLLPTTVGVNGGEPTKYTKSAWVFYHGVQIHLEWIDFGSMEEIKRIVTLVCRWNRPGALTEKRGYIVNTMPDKSRVLALRPQVAESWAVFIRKFNLTNLTPEYLIDKPYTHNAQLVINFIKYMFKGKITGLFTGRQGSGKTTMLTACMRYINPKATIRVIEMAPELYLRELYQHRNILSLQETPFVSAEMEQDALKKSDGVVSLMGEIATDKMAHRTIQMSMTASECTYGTHHGNTPKDTILTLRNSLSASGNFPPEIAEKQVTDAIRLILHMERDSRGKFYIDLVSEIVQKEEGIPYPEYDANDPENSKNRIFAEMAYRMTDRINFEVRDIIKYDTDTDTYVAVNRLTKLTEDRIRNNIESPNEKRLFDFYMMENWGITKTDVDEYFSENSDKVLSKSNIPTTVISALKEQGISTPSKEQLVRAQEDVITQLRDETQKDRAYLDSRAKNKGTEDYDRAQEDVESMIDLFESAQALLEKDKTREILASEYTAGLFDF